MDPTTSGTEVTTGQPAKARVRPRSAKHRNRGRQLGSDGQIGSADEPSAGPNEDNVRSDQEYLDLGAAAEDVIEPQPIDESEPPLPVPTAVPNDDVVISQPSEKVYVQATAGFRKAKRQQFEDATIERRSKSGDAATVEGPPEAEAIRSAIAGQNVFKSLAHIIHGMLAGFSVVQCVLVMETTPPNFSYSDFVVHYAPLALPFHCVYYVALIICTVAVLDRYDVGQSFVRMAFRAITFQSGGLAVVFSIAAVILHQITAGTEERVTRFYRNATEGLTGSPDFFEEGWLENELSLWRAVLIAKATLITMSWILVSMRPTTNLLAKHLRQSVVEYSQETVQSISERGTTTNS